MFCSACMIKRKQGSVCAENTKPTLLLEPSSVRRSTQGGRFNLCLVCVCERERERERELACEWMSECERAEGREREREKEREKEDSSRGRGRGRDRDRENKEHSALDPLRAGNTLRR